MKIIEEAHDWCIAEENGKYYEVPLTDAYFDDPEEHDREVTAISSLPKEQLEELGYEFRELPEGWDMEEKVEVIGKSPRGLKIVRIGNLYVQQTKKGGWRAILTEEEFQEMLRILKEHVDDEGKILRKDFEKILLSSPKPMVSRKLGRKKIELIERALKK